MKKKALAFLALVIVLGATAAGAFYWRQQQTPESGLVLYGNVDIREADLAFNNQGRIEAMLVEEGDEVKKGQLLATLDATSAEAEVALAEARVAAQQAVLDRLLRGSRPEKIRQVRAKVAAAEAELANVQIDVRRAKKLVKNGYAPQARLDDTLSLAAVATAKLRQDKEELALAIKGPRVEDIANAKAILMARKASLAIAARGLRDTKLYAKEAGTVLTRIQEPGAVVLANTPVYTIALGSPLWVRTYVAEPDLGRIHPGMKAEIFTDSAPNKIYRGWVGFISPVAEFTPKSVETTQLRTSLVYRLRVYVKNKDNGLRQGMPVTVRLLNNQAGGGNDNAPKG